MRQKKECKRGLRQERMDERQTEWQTGSERREEGRGKECKAVRKNRRD